MPIGWRRGRRKWVRKLRFLLRIMLCESISNLQAAFFKNPQSKDSHQPLLILFFFPKKKKIIETDEGPYFQLK